MWSSLYCFGHKSRHSFDFFFWTLLGWLFDDAELDVDCSSLEFPFSVLSNFSCSNELFSPLLFCFSDDCVEYLVRLSLLLTALDIAPLFLKLLKRGFLSWIGEPWSSCWAFWQLSSHTVNSISPRSIALAEMERGQAVRGKVRLCYSTIF